MHKQWMPFLQPPHINIVTYCVCSTVGSSHTPSGPLLSLSGPRLPQQLWKEKKGTTNTCCHMYNTTHSLTDNWYYISNPSIIAIFSLETTFNKCMPLTHHIFTFVQVLTTGFSKVKPSKLGMERIATEWEWVHSGVGLSAHAQCLVL